MKHHGIQISMDGKGCWRDNAFLERRWKSINYERSLCMPRIPSAQRGLERYLMFYNRQRPHRALDGQTPDQVYCDNLTARWTIA